MLADVNHINTEVQFTWESTHAELQMLTRSPPGRTASPTNQLTTASSLRSLKIHRTPSFQYLNHYS